MHAVHVRCACCMLTVNSAAHKLVQVGLVASAVLCMCDQGCLGCNCAGCKAFTQLFIQLPNRTAPTATTELLLNASTLHQQGQPVGVAAVILLDTNTMSSTQAWPTAATSFVLRAQVLTCLYTELPQNVVHPMR